MGRGFKGFHEYCSIIEILAAKISDILLKELIWNLPENDAFKAYLLTILKNIFVKSFHYPIHENSPSKFKYCMIQQAWNFSKLLSILSYDVVHLLSTGEVGTTLNWGFM